MQTTLENSGRSRHARAQRSMTSHAKLLRYFCVAVAGLALSASLAFSATTIDLDSGASGSLTGSPQSYNESRSVDVTVLSPMNLLVSSMTLVGFDGSGIATSADIGARIYDANTQLLVASADVTISSVGPVTIPISATLVSGDEYRVGFFASTTPPNNGEGILFEPNSFPYTETNGLLQINGDYDVGSDSFPANTNTFGPQVSLEVTPVPEPASMALLGLGLLGVLGFRRCFLRPPRHTGALPGMWDDSHRQVADSPRRGLTSDRRFLHL